LLNDFQTANLAIFLKIVKLMKYAKLEFTHGKWDFWGQQGTMPMDINILGKLEQQKLNRFYPESSKN